MTRRGLTRIWFSGERGRSHGRLISTRRSQDAPGTASRSTRLLLTSCSRQDDTRGHGTTTDDTGRHAVPDPVRGASNPRIRWPKGRGSSSLPSRTCALGSAGRIGNRSDRKGSRLVVTFVPCCARSQPPAPLARVTIARRTAALGRQKGIRSHEAMMMHGHRIKRRKRSQCVFSGPEGAKIQPNGRIVFTRYDVRVGGVVSYTMDPDGSHVQQLFFNGHSEWPHWSPDGSQIAIFCCDDGMVAHIVDVDTGAFRELAPSDPTLETPAAGVPLQPRSMCVKRPRPHHPGGTGSTRSERPTDKA